MSQSAHDAFHRENEARIGANRSRARLLCASAGVAPAIVLGVILGSVAGPVVGAIVAAVVEVAASLAAARWALSVALVLVGGRAVRPESVPALATEVDGLCGTLGVHAPQLRVVDDAVPNACVLAGAGTEVLVVTSGLLDRLDLIELEGVLAHELSHVKRHDAVVSAVAVATTGLVAAATGTPAILHRAVGRGREYGADRAAVLAVRYPPGLHGALVALGSGPAPAPGSVFTGRRWAATRWIWIDPMVGAADPAPVGELDATVVRTAALAEW